MVKIMWFENIFCIEDLKKQYKTLCKKYHPDLNSYRDTNKEMQSINAEYDALFEKYKNIHKKQNGEVYTADFSEHSDEFKNIINSIIHLNVEIEIIGSWIWCFKAYEAKDVLKKLGFKYASKKKAWCWHSAKYTPSRRKMKLDDIRTKYGSEKVKDKEELKCIA